MSWRLATDTSRQSHNSTRSQSPDPPSEEQQRHEERKWKLKREREASFPYWQFDAQTNGERQRIIEANENRNTPCTSWYGLLQTRARKRQEPLG